MGKIKIALQQEINLRKKVLPVIAGVGGFLRILTVPFEWFDSLF